MHRALVTGATGFVGGHLVRRLVERNWDVHALLRAGSPGSRLESGSNRITSHVSDGRMQGLVEILDMVKPQVVFHLASLFLVEHKSEEVPALLESNVAFGARLLEAAWRSGTRCVVNAGTSWQHFGEAEYSPVNLYAATKQAFQDICRFYVEARGMNITTLKLFDTYGPRDPRKKLLSALLSAARDGTVLKMSPGEQKMDLVHVDDVVEAFCLAADMLVGGEVSGASEFMVASGSPVRLKELVALCEKAIGKPINVEWGALPYRQRTPMEPWSRGRRLAGWKPRIDLAEGIRRVAEAMEEREGVSE